MFKNKMNLKSRETLVQTAPSVLSNVSEPPSPVSFEPADKDAPPVPVTPKPHFLTSPATEEERPKLKRNFFHNWVDPADWKESDLARVNPESGEEYERFLVRNGPTYIPMKPEQVAQLPPEERQEYENSFKITETPKRYALRSRSY